jgi:hypothetical protein
MEKPMNWNDLVPVAGDWKTEDTLLWQRGRYARRAYPRTIAAEPILGDVTIRVRLRLEDGQIDRAGGVIFRARDADNYYLARANALEDNVRFYRVVGGTREQLASAELKVTAKEWHTLAVKLRGDRVLVSWDGTQLLDATDATYARGTVGLWTKADSITAFADLAVIADG